MTLSVRRLCHAAAALLLLLCYPLSALADSAPARVDAPGLGDPGTLARLVVETGFPEGKVATLRGKDSQQQLLVSGQFSSGQQRDLTRDVAYETSPPGIVTVDASGLVLPVTDGQVTVTAVHLGGTRASVNLAVTNTIHDTPINFPNQIVPIFT